MQKLTRLQKRKYRVRSKIYGTSVKPRLSVYRSNKHIYAQIIDDEKGITLCSANDLQLKEKDNLVSANKVGEEIAKQASKKKIKEVVFDRNGRKFHGRVKALATGAREKGLKF